jgi:hypothetical protein
MLAETFPGQAWVGGMGWIALLIIEELTELKESLPPLLIPGERSVCALKVVLVILLPWEGERWLTLEILKLRSWLDVG